MSPETDPLLAEARDRIAKGSQSFALAARLFPPALFRDCVLLYAWCRHCDDVIDGQSLGQGGQALSPGQSAAALAALRAETEAALAGEPSAPVFAGLAEVITRHRLDPRHPFDLLKGFQMDAEARRYPDLPALLEYCYHVAGVVGIMMAWIMGVRDAAVLRRASDLGIAFQLTNIARDVVADADAGRCYLPESWLQDSGADPALRETTEQRAALHGLRLRLLAEAEPYYRSARHGARFLPWRAAWAILTAARIYRAIGTRLKRLGPEALAIRASTGKGFKLMSVAASLPPAANFLPAGSGPARRGLYTPVFLRESA